MLANLGRIMTNYFAVTHPSQPNYWFVLWSVLADFPPPYL